PELLQPKAAHTEYTWMAPPSYCAICGRTCPAPMSWWASRSTLTRRQFPISMGPSVGGARSSRRSNVRRHSLLDQALTGPAIQCAFGCGAELSHSCADAKTPTSATSGTAKGLGV